MSDFYPPFSSEPELRRYQVMIAGAGTGGAVSRVLGSEVAVTYAGVGLVTLTWNAKDERPGQPFGPDGFAFSAATPANVKGYSMVAGVYAPTTRTLAINIYDASNNLVDLKANEFLSFPVLFRSYKM